MRRLALFALASCALLSACASARPLPYNWGNYPFTLYRLKKDPSNETLQAHKQVLVQIIQVSNQQSMRVPPGVFAEYGYILVKEGQTEEGLKYLDLEAQTYPESKVFVERVKAQASQPTGEKEQKK
jgi:hypothetical protein